MENAFRAFLLEGDTADETVGDFWEYLVDKDIFTQKCCDSPVTPRPTSPEACAPPHFKIVSSKFPKKCIQAKKNGETIAGACKRPAKFSVQGKNLVTAAGKCLTSKKKKVTIGPCGPTALQLSATSHAAFHVKTSDGQCLMVAGKKQKLTIVKCKPIGQHFPAFYGHPYILA